MSSLVLKTTLTPSAVIYKFVLFVLRGLLTNQDVAELRRLSLVFLANV